MRKIPIIIVVFGVLIGFEAISFYLSESVKVPTYIFAREVPLEGVLVPDSIVELKALDVARFRGLSEALQEAVPEARAMTPRVTSNLVGMILVDFLGGQSTDLRRARVVNIVHVYSVEAKGKYYNLVIVFHESRTRATQNGWYWLDII
jgi:hypothetical protein